GREDGAERPALVSDGPAFTTFGDRVEVRNSDGAWTVWWAFDPDSSLAPGAIARFVPRDEAVPLVDDAKAPGTINDPRHGGLGAFGWHHARRAGCCDAAPPLFASVDDAGEADIDPDHAWGIDSRSRAPFGVSAISHSAPERDERGDVGFQVVLDFSDGWHDPVLTATYSYEFYDGSGELGGGVRVWIEIEERCGDSCRAAGGTDFPNAFVKEPKIVAALAPLPDGSIRYPHVTVFDDGESPRAIGQCNLGELGDAASPGSSCQVGRRQLEAGASRLRFDEGLGGCPESECFHASFRAYPGGLPPRAGASLRWSDERNGLWAWAAASDRRACFGLFGAGRERAGSCRPPIGETAGGCVNVAGDPGVPRQWELHRRGGWGQALVAGWTGGHGGYDCPLASRAFGPDGETWGIYANYSYGPGWDLQTEP
ncbi:MAG: hypothetical protein H0V40_05505, partial [Actinobacteria bacterium]|nr:hypothetical protein [Actinomycetota bacterium]